MSRKLFIPSIGTEIKLEEDWTFNLYRESRNSPLWKELFDEKLGWGSSAGEFKKVTLAKGTSLTVRRIYIRQQKSKYDSITFSVTGIPDDVPKTRLKKRFWAKLGDINEIRFSVEGGAPSSDGLLFVMAKYNSEYVRQTNNKFFNLEEAVDWIKDQKNSEELYIFRAPSGTKVPKYSRRNRSSQITSNSYPHADIEGTYELVYEPVGPLGKGKEVNLKRSRWEDNDYARLVPKDPRDFFSEPEDREHIEGSDSIYALVDEARSAEKYRSEGARGAIIYRVGGKWYGKLTGELRNVSPTLYTKFCSIHDGGLAKFRTLTEGVGFMKDFFEENLTEYASNIRKVESRVAMAAKNGVYKKTA